MAKSIPPNVPKQPEAKAIVTALDVLSRVVGCGSYEAQTILAKISPQDQSAIVAAYEAEDVHAIHEILGRQNKPAEEPKAD